MHMGFHAQSLSTSFSPSPVSSLPFLKERSSDENTYAPCVIETLSLLGTLMKIESDPLRQQVAQAVADFYTAEPNEAQAEGNRKQVIFFKKLKKKKNI